MKEDIKKYSNKKLANQFRVYYNIINELECFGVRDVLILMLLEREIVDRDGYILFPNVVINGKKY